MAVETSIPSATSVVDFLNTKKQDSSFGARKKLYTDLGFEKRLGSFVGGANQNLALLRELQKQETGGNTVVSPGAPAVTPTAPNTEKPAFNISSPSTPFNLGKTQTSTPMTASDVLKSVGFTDIPAPAPTPTLPIQPPVKTAETPKAPSQPAPSGSGMASTPENFQTNDTSTKEATGISAASIYPDIFGEKDKDLTEGDFINRWLNSSEGQLFLERQNLKGMTEEAKAETLKKELESKYKSEKESLEQKLAENGLAFSGIRGTKVKALADALAASELEVDRELASKLLDANLDLREAILKGVADLAKDAQDGRKEAIQQLNAVGYAVINGQLVPTLSSLAGERAQRSLELSERRLQLAEEAARNPNKGNKLTLSEVESRGLPKYLVGQSEESIANSFYSPTPPDWFVKKVNDDNKQSVAPAEVQRLWDKEAPNYINGVKESNDHAKATSYFKSAYGSTLSGEQIKALADRVELYVNGGESYSEAIGKVIKEATKK